MVIVVPSSQKETNVTPCQNAEFSHVPRSSSGVVRVPTGQSKQNSKRGKRKLAIVKSLGFFTVSFVLRMEVMVLDVPNMVFLKHSSE